MRTSLSRRSTRAAVMSKCPAGEAPGDGEAHHQPEAFCQHRGIGGAGDAVAENEHKKHGRRHVDDVDDDLQQQGGSRAGDADQPAEHGKVGERAWCRPHPHEEVGLRCRAYRVAAAQCAIDRGGHRRLQGDQEQADQPGHH